MLEKGIRGLEVSGGAYILHFRFCMWICLVLVWVQLDGLLAKGYCDISRVSVPADAEDIVEVLL